MERGGGKDFAFFRKTSGFSPEPRARVLALANPASFDGKA